MVDYDEDWYHIYLNDGDTVDIYIYFNNFDGDLQLELYDPSNNFQAGSWTSDSSEHILYIVDMSGEWRIRV